MDNNIFETKYMAILNKAEEMRLLINDQNKKAGGTGELPEEATSIRIYHLRDSNWYVEIHPSLMTFGNMFTHLMTRSVHGKTIEEAMNEALKGISEEVELLKQGKTIGV